MKKQNLLEGEHACSYDVHMRGFPKPDKREKIAEISDWLDVSQMTCERLISMTPCVTDFTSCRDSVSRCHLSKGYLHFQMCYCFTVWRMTAKAARIEGPLTFWKFPRAKIKRPIILPWAGVAYRARLGGGPQVLWILSLLLLTTSAFSQPGDHLLAEPCTGCSVTSWTSVISVKPAQIHDMIDHPVVLSSLGLPTIDLAGQTTN